MTKSKTDLFAFRLQTTESQKKSTIDLVKHLLRRIEQETQQGFLSRFKILFLLFTHHKCLFDYCLFDIFNRVHSPRGERDRLCVSELFPNIPLRNHSFYNAFYIMTIAIQIFEGFLVKN